jgi:hypothetical protein
MYQKCKLSKKRQTTDTMRMFLAKKSEPRANVRLFS